MSCDAECFNDELFLSDELLLGVAAVEHGSEIGVGNDGVDEVGDQGDGAPNRGAVERALMWVTETQVMMTAEMYVIIMWQLSVVVYQCMVTNILVVMTVWMIFVTPVVVLLGEQ